MRVRGTSWLGSFALSLALGGWWCLGLREGGREQVAGRQAAVGAPFVGDGEDLLLGGEEPLAQGIISEQCNQYHTCSLLDSFLSAGKWIGNAEYAPETQAEFCASDNAANINGILFNVNLNGGRKPCR